MEKKNILLILENHVDKIVMGVIALLSLVLLWIYVIGNPYGVEVDNRKRSPSQIDRYIKQKADQLRTELDNPAAPDPYDKTYASQYEQQLQCPVSDITATAVLLPLPGVGQVQIVEDRLYTLPEIPPLATVKAAHLRGAAQVPTEPIGPDRTYEAVLKEPDDVDLVTVSSRFDVQTLYNNFQQSFTGPRLKTSWKDSRLARPVFARLELQRRARQDDGSWGPWQEVSRSRIDTYQKLLQELPLTLDQSQFGIDIWSSQYDRREVQFDILQPASYMYLISRVEWMPPEFMDESLTILARQEEQAKRDLQQQRQQQREMRDTRTNTDRTRTPAQRTTRTRPQPAERERNRQPDYGMMDPMMGERMPAVKTAPKERTVDDVKKDLDKELLTEKTNLNALPSPLLVWAHDDTAQPGMTYQYRIRMGVFNPIAGKDWFVREQENFKNQIILWSAYSEPTKDIVIPRRVYAFPMDVVAQKETPEQIAAVKVEVTKYQLGRWHDHEFEVLPGQAIGYELEDEDKKTQDPTMMGVYDPMMDGMGMGIGTPGQPQLVDFSTNCTLVDVYRQNLWDSRLRPKTLYQMLYTNKEQSIEQVAIGKANWDSRTRQEYARIQEEMAQSVQQRSSGMMPGMNEPILDPMMMDQMMMMDPMMMDHGARRGR